MKEIDLLPIDLSPNRRIAKISATVERVNLFLLGFFLVAIALGIGIIVFLRTEISVSQNKQASITKSIKNLEPTEQKLFLTKDRIQKIKDIQSDGNNRINDFGLVDHILSSLPPSVSPFNVQIENDKKQFSVISKDSLATLTFLSSLVVTGDYKNLTLESLTFSPDNGYLITLQL